MGFMDKVSKFDMAVNRTVGSMVERKAKDMARHPGCTDEQREGFMQISRDAEELYQANRESYYSSYGDDEDDDY